MNNGDIRKYAIFAIVCFLSFFGYVVNAKETAVITPGKEATLIASINYENAVCYINNKQITSDIDYNDGKYHIYYDGSDIKVRSTEDAINANLSIFCTYDNYFEIQNANRVWKSGAGDLTMEINSYSMSGASQITIDMDEQFNSEYTITSWVGNMGTMEEVNISDPKLNMSACVTGTDVCKISLNSPITSSSRVTGTIKYRDKESGATNTLTVIINIRDTWFLKADGGNYAKTCSFDSALWEKRDNSSNVWYSKQGTDISYNNVSFPSCEVDTAYNPLIEFKGWVYQKRDANIDSFNAGLLSGTFQTADYCTTVANQYPELFGFAAVGEHIDPRDIHYGYVFACYGSKGIAIDLNGGSVNLDNNIWKLYTSSNGLFSPSHGYNGLYSYTDGGNITLPSAVEPPLIFANTAEFVGWKNRTTGVVVPGGTVVSGTDGTIYSAVYQQKGNSSGGGNEIQIGGYEVKTVFVNERTEIILENGYTCNAYEDSYFKIENGGTVAGESRCTIIGKSSTNGQFINVPFANENGATFTYKIMVTTRDGLGGTPVTGTPVINVQINIDALKDQNLSPATSIKGYSCQAYRVGENGKANEKDISHNYITNLNYKNEYQFNIMRYNLTCAQDGYDKNKIYNSLCLDPGLKSPKVGTLYNVSENIEPNSNNEFHKAISYISLRMLESGNDISGSDWSAANIAARIVQFANGMQGKSASSSILAAHHKAYEDIANSLKGKIATASVTREDIIKDGVLQIKTCTEGECVGDSLEQLIDFLNYNSNDAKNAISQMSRPTHTLKGNVVDGSYEFEGTIQLPKNSTITSGPQFVGQTGRVEGQYIHHNPETDTITYGGRLNAATSLPAGTDLGVSFTYSSPYSLDNVMLLIPTGTQLVYQRFIAFNDNLDVIFYVDFSGNNCDVLIDDLRKNPDNKDSANKLVSAGCCTTELQHSNPNFYNKYCRSNCVYDSTYKLEDGSNDFVCTNDAQDVNEIKEATSNLNQGNYACIVDITQNTGGNVSAAYQQALTATENMKDFRGNQLSVSDYNSTNGSGGNPYCRVTCKEDYAFNTPGFSNFTGTNAVKAGSYFTIGGNISISSTMTCVTTYIDVNSYINNVTNLTKQITDNTNEYLARASAMSNRNIKDGAPVTIYTTYERTGAVEIEEKCGLNDGDKKECTITTDPITKQPIAASGTYKTGKYTVTYTAKESTCIPKVLYVNGGTTYPKYDYTSGGSYRTLIGYTNEVTSPYNEGEKTKEEVCDNAQCGAEVEIGKDKNGKPIMQYIEDYGINMDAGGSCEIYNSKEEAIAASTPGLTYNGSNITDSMLILSTTINNLKYQLSNDAKNFGKCQNFYLYNDRNVNNSNNSVYGSSNVYESSDGDGNLSSTGESVKIADLFDPEIRYKYDEEVYMSYIGDGNRYILDEFQGGENEISYYNSINDISNYTGTSASDARQVYARTLCTVPSNTSGNYNSNTMYCKQVYFYYYNAHYIKNSLSQSGTFKNNVTWFQRQYGNIVYPGSGGTLQERLDTAKRNSGNPGDSTPWTRLGENDVFPVQLNTRRNIYQYVFTFENIGNYMNGGLGRLMGSEQSLAMYNFNTCFYEVYEGMCLCCGRTMSSTARVENDTNIDSSKYLSLSDSSIGKQGSSSGTLGFYTDSVSLSDLAGAAPGFDKNSNWGSESEFYYNGEVYYTDKGSSLASSIQNRGETIYASTPEYSYTLNPSALSAIKNMDHSSSYAVQSGDLTAVGSYMIKGGTASTDGANNILFTHFKSNFLDKIKGYETAEYKAFLFTNKQMYDKCHVSNAEDVTNSNYSDCRWIDYMDNDGFRLAFK